MKKNEFILEPMSHVYTSEAFCEFAYADGTEAELLHKLKAAGNIGPFSAELKPWKNWSEEYHFSPYRQNVLVPLLQHLKNGAKILELGAGCGAITYALGSKGFIVDAVEGSFARASVARERCRDFSNVTVFNSNFENIEFGKSYDVVTLIGVFEYSSVYVGGENPFQAVLEIAKSHLKEDGILIIAIENKIGVKYLSGYKEDHVGKPYFGISNCYNTYEPTPFTFTKCELTRLLALEGFEAPCYFDAYPDYKLPTALLSEAAYENAQFSVAQLLTTVQNSNSGESSPPPFFEAGLMESLESEGIASSFASSFIAISGFKKIAPPDWIAMLFAFSRRQEFSTETVFRDVNGKIQVEKRAVERNDCVLGELIHSPQTEPYVEGQSLLFKGRKLLHANSSASWNEFAKLIVLYKDFLFKNSSGDSMLPGEFVDATPSNLILTRDGEIKYFDREWRFSEEIPLSFVFYRGVLTFFSNVSQSLYLGRLDCSSMNSFIRNFLSTSRNDNCFEDYIKYETRFRFAATGEVFDQYAARRFCKENIQIRIVKIIVKKFISDAKLFKKTICNILMQKRK